MKLSAKLPRRSTSNLLAACSAAATILCGCFGGVTVLRAATRCTHPQSPPPAWHAVETANFRILNYGSRPVDAHTAAACEALRERLVARWLGPDIQPTWTPKCDLVLHPTDAAYLREVGGGGRDTIASALVDRQHGRVTGRRIDIRAVASDWQHKALGHELTHVVLADRFAAHALPRWVDEGLAILADSAEKQGMHLRDLQNALAARNEFRVLELVTLADYPAAQRWGTFYGQSASLVQFLVDQHGSEQFLKFVELSQDRGYEQGLRQVYRFGIAELERRWKSHLSAPAVANRTGPQSTESRPSVLARPVSLHAEPPAAR